MTTTITPKLDPIYGPQKADAWTNLDFTKSGSSFVWPQTFHSEETARTAVLLRNTSVDEEHARVIREYGGVGIEITDEEWRHLYFWYEYSHTLQLPADKP